MDTEAGRFVEEESAEDWMQRISVGEEIPIKGETCVVTAISDREVTLKLLSREDRLTREAAAGESLMGLRDEILREESRLSLRAELRGPLKPNED